MTAKQAFSTAYQRTLVATRSTLDPAHFEECWLIAERFRATLFDEAASSLNASASFLPRPSEWAAALRRLDGERTMSEARERERVASAYLSERTFSCPVCLDTGWEPCRCVLGAMCGSCRKRGYQLYEHSYVTECLCRPNNPVYQHKRDANKKHLQGNQQKERHHDAA